MSEWWALRGQVAATDQRRHATQYTRPRHRSFFSLHLYDRGGAHRHDKKIARWLSGVEEDELPFGEYAAAQVQVAPEPPEPDCGDSDCGDSDCGEDHDAEDAKAEILAGRPGDIRDACKRLVATLPPSFREDMRSDAAALAAMCMRLCPGKKNHAGKSSSFLFTCVRRLNTPQNVPTLILVQSNTRSTIFCDD